jgi:chromosome condensin MukBEF complex kleisin-like MukF subunit
VIVRVMGEGQWRVDDDLVAGLNEIDNRVAQAVTIGDEVALRDGLRQLADAIRSGGTKLADDDLSASDVIVPPEDLSLEEARELLSGDGLIPDLPA